MPSDRRQSGLGFTSNTRNGARRFATREQARERKYTEGVPLAKVIPCRLTHAHEIVMLRKPSSIAASSFRRLSAELAAMDGGGPQVVVVTSPEPEEGKSFIAVNLALAMAADTGKRVLLLDADLRRPRIDRWLNPAPKVGLAELLSEKAGLEHAIIGLKNTSLKVVAAGAPPSETAELLASDVGRKLLTGLREHFDRIVIDTPPIVPYDDANVIGAWSDGILLVTRAGRTREMSFLQALSSISLAPILGTVFNDEVA